VPPVKYELGFYIPEDDILHSHSRENFKCYKDINVMQLSKEREESEKRSLNNNNNNNNQVLKTMQQYPEQAR
jgi:hypothetical protein